MFLYSFEFIEHFYDLWFQLFIRYNDYFSLILVFFFFFSIFFPPGSSIFSFCLAFYLYQFCEIVNLSQSRMHVLVQEHPYADCVCSVTLVGGLELKQA